MNVHATTSAPAAAASFADVELEQALIGVCLIDEVIAAESLGLCTPEDFAEPLHRDIWDVMRGLRDKGQTVSPLSVGWMLNGSAMLKDVGGKPYLISLAKAAPVMPNFRDYARMLVDLRIRRQADAELEEARVRLTVQSTPPFVAMQGVIAVARMAADTEAKAAGYLALPETLDAVVYDLEQAAAGTPPEAIRAGLSDLDELTGGFQAADMVVIAGRPGAGKTVALGRIALTAALEFRPVVFFEIEMSGRQIMHRLICDFDYDTKGDAKPLSYNRMRRGKLFDGEFDRIFAAQRELRVLPMSIFDTPSMALSEIAAHAERIADKATKMGAVLIDYLQIVQPSERYGGSKVAEVTEVSNGIKRLAKRLRWPVIVGCQLNRAMESRTDKERRPILADLRESGAIEQDADIVIGLHRPAAALERKRPEKGKADPGWLKWLGDVEEVRNHLELWLLKNRSGPTGMVKAHVEIGASAIRPIARPANSENDPAEGLLL